MKHALPLLLFVFFMACNPPVNNNEQAASTAKTDSSANTSFINVSDYIGGQVKLIVDSFKYPLSKTITINGKSSLSGATDDELRALAAQFRNPNISDSALKKFYKETSIADQSNALITFEYVSIDPSLPVQKIDVYIKGDPVEADKITSVYIEKNFASGDTSFSQKLYWKAARNAQIITEKKLAGKSLPAEQVKIAWDPSE
jgi:hypothetical protein